MRETRVVETRLRCEDKGESVRVYLRVAREVFNSSRGTSMLIAARKAAARKDVSARRNLPLVCVLETRLHANVPMGIERARARFHSPAGVYSHMEIATR